MNKEQRRKAIIDELFLNETLQGFIEENYMTSEFILPDTMENLENWVDSCITNADKDTILVFSRFVKAVNTAIERLK